MHLHTFKILTLDCYGTLIDWETGILNALQPLLQKSSLRLSDDELLEIFARHEVEQEAQTPAMLYRDVLTIVHDRIAKELRIKTSDEENKAFGYSVKNWPAFEDSPAALHYLKQHYKLVILSNVDCESFKGSNARLHADFDWIFTAQDISSYKPSPKNFEYLITQLSAKGYDKKDILHTAESLFHDHAPANKIGLASAWIHRRHAKYGFGATSKPSKMPHYDFRFTSLAEMVAAHQHELATQMVE
jgi:2-haloalkanoic acid dehalogenase type II